MPTAAVISPGILTTVQDLGRFGNRHLGVPVSGAVDHWAMAAANRLVGNMSGAACLEITMAGPSLQFKRNCIVALTGADMSPTISGVKAPMWESFLCGSGTILSFGHRKEGCRTYAAFLGGIEVPPILGSRSTFLTGSFGGLKGRRLLKGDYLKVGHGGNLAKMNLEGLMSNRIIDHLRPVYCSENSIRVIPGIDAHLFSDEEYGKLYSTRYIVTNQTNRMGCNLKGNNMIVSLKPAEAESFPVTPGSIQVLPSGKPVILLNDAQSTGGYPQIACVISADLWKIAQAVPGDRINFHETKTEDALKLLKDINSESVIMEKTREARFISKTSKNRYEVTICVDI